MNTHEALEKYKNIAVYGMSKNPEKAAHTVPAFISRKGYNVFPINPTATEINKIKTYPDLMSVPERIDILNVFRPSEEALSIVKEAIERKNAKDDISVIWLQKGIISEEAKALAEENTIDFIQDKCMYVEYVEYEKSKRDN